MVALDIAGTSIDEGGAVYVALRNAVESHTGKPIPADDEFDRWKGTGKRQAIAGLLGDVPVDEIDAVESEFTRQLLDAYSSTPPTPLPGIADAFAVLRDHDVKVALQTGYSRAIARPAPRAGRLAGRARHRRGDHQRPGASKPPRAVPDLPRDGNRWGAERFGGARRRRHAQRPAGRDERRREVRRRGADRRPRRRYAADRTAHPYPDQCGDDSRGPRAARAGDVVISALLVPPNRTDVDLFWSCDLRHYCTWPSS